MQSARQKKRSSQQKKRYHERAKAKGTTENTPPVGRQDQKQQQKVEKAPNTLKTEQNDASTKPSPREKQLGNNWDRYEGILMSLLQYHSTYSSCFFNTESPADAETTSLSNQDNEELLHQRLVQLMNLPTHHHKSPMTPSPSDSTDDAGSPFLTLDCEALATSLSTLPLYTRLDLSLELLELCDEAPSSPSSDTPATSSSQEMVESTSHFSKSQKKIDLTECILRKDNAVLSEMDHLATTPFQASEGGHRQDLMDRFVPGMLKPEGKKAEVKNEGRISGTVGHSEGSGGDSENGKRLTSAPPPGEREGEVKGLSEVRGQRLVATKGRGHHEEDEELEKLLEMSSEIGLAASCGKKTLKSKEPAATSSGKTVHSADKELEAPSQENTKRTSASSQSTTMAGTLSSPVITPAGPQEEVDVAELDDMLDELLN